MNDLLTILRGDALEMLRTLPDESVHCCVTSPPYWGLRDYQVNGQLGLEKTPDEYVAKLVEIFREVKRVLRKDGTCWVNLGDSYAMTTKGSGGHAKIQDNNGGSRLADRSWQIPDGLKPKDLVGIPWRVAFALQADGWYLRQDIIWAKPNPMPESVTDRCTKAHEYIFLLSKNQKYWYDQEAIKEASLDPESYSGRRKRFHFGHGDADPVKGRTAAGFRKLDGEIYENRNRRSVWTITAQPYPEAHFATFPEEIPKLCVLAGCPVGGTVLDPFAGSGTTGKVAIELGRKAILIELNPKYVEMIKTRCNTTPGFQFA